MPAMTVPPKLVLASASPRRQALLKALVPVFRILEAAVDETPRAGEDPRGLARRLALAKARAGALKTEPGSLVLGADTVVALGGAVLGKPGSMAEARDFLARLRDRRHDVITALALVSAADGASWQAEEVTAVWLRAYGQDEVEAYLASGDPFDKAGGYAIQHGDFRPVARLVGSATNVVGLPLARTAWLLGRAGWAAEAG
jgi:septum formation protein